MTRPDSLFFLDHHVFLFKLSVIYVSLFSFISFKYDDSFSLIRGNFNMLKNTSYKYLYFAYL